MHPEALRWCTDAFSALLHTACADGQRRHTNLAANFVIVADIDYAGTHLARGLPGSAH
ncbi:hypothetical protein [Streptomyces globisporus]|uniref:hypothetical protein n=1 Tax=Streptomyces globisporus TaxID=1908 RepID=UPI002F90734D|nr:hypothetical protein OG449_34805 [Streptomyces globisporus]